MVHCFSILENVIILLACQEDEGAKCKIKEESKLQLHTTLMEFFAFLVRSLKTLTDGKSLQSQPTLSYLTAVIRLLGAWLAEDSLSLTDELYSLLPFLIGQCYNIENDTLKFLLPGFNHLVTETKSRRILIGSGLMNVLMKHMQYYSDRYVFITCSCLL